MKMQTTEGCRISQSLKEKKEITFLRTVEMNNLFPFQTFNQSGSIQKKCQMQKPQIRYPWLSYVIKNLPTDIKSNEKSSTESVFLECELSLLNELKFQSLGDLFLSLYLVCVYIN